MPLVVTSPPYWTIKDYNATSQIGHGDGYEAYLEALDEVWARCYARLLPGCKMCVNVGDQFLRAKTHGRYRVLPIRERIISSIMALGADYMGAIIWKKMTNTNTTGGGSLMGSYPHPRNGVLKIDYEFILIFKKPGQAPRGTPSQKAKSAMDMDEWSRNFSAHWDIAGERQRGHHAMFPRELPRRLIRMYSFPGERVLDPFAGSGTTIDVAIEQGRVGEGIEINSEFEEVMRERWVRTPRRFSSSVRANKGVSTSLRKTSSGPRPASTSWSVSGGRTLAAWRWSRDRLRCA